jgi:indolepyruvate ferredoxin oxidoreductase
MLAPTIDVSYRIDDCYVRDHGQVWLTGTQALVRLAMLQRQADIAAGLDTAGFISGYRGSPLGGVDLALWKASDHLAALGIRFQPAINEELAATAILGTQQVETEGAATVDGVFGIWYGKGPGLDRAGDALKHGNALGSSPRGGVLVVAGDDHGSVSSSMPHQSDQSMIAWSMPVLHPATIEDYLHFGLYGFALSRFTGLWTGFKAISETVESAATVTLPPELPRFAVPAGFEAPEGGLHYRWADGPGTGLEDRMAYKIEAARAFLHANPINRTIVGTPDARLGIVTVGKAHLDLMEALRKLGLGERDLKRAGIRILKIGCVWPLGRGEVESFARGLRLLWVVEEKGPVVEDQLRSLLFNAPDDRRPRIVGKHDLRGAPLVPAAGELRPSVLAPLVVKVGDGVIDETLVQRLRQRLGAIAGATCDAGLTEAAVKRTPYFCSGCPHNTSTRVPDGSKAMTGIGCHYMAAWMGRETSGMIQMGGEGANWVGVAPFTKTRHVFQNLGDGTYYHSGLLAIRQAVAAGIDITYKILFNDAVAMTGGQPVDGPIGVAEIARQVLAEGVRRVTVVSDEPEKYPAGYLPAGISARHRDDLMAIQREFRDIRGTSVIIYDQTCAAEKRRRRKRGLMAEPARRVFINQRVCEGCGDCSVKSNCTSVLPMETPFGTKRTIDQSACNKDFSCLDGFCPSFVTVEPGEGADSQPDRLARFADRIRQEAGRLDQPDRFETGDIHELLIAGVGGTGVVTVGAVIAMAAHLEGRRTSVLDFMGFAQKGGAVLSHVRIADRGAGLNQVRIDKGCADVLLACDRVVGSGPDALATLRQGHSRVLCNTHDIPTAAFVRDRNARLDGDDMLARLRGAAGRGNVETVDAQAITGAIAGNTVGANMFMLGYAFEMGLVPLSHDALMRAIEINGVAVSANRTIFQLGRLAVARPDAVATWCDEARVAPAVVEDETLDALIDRLAGELVAYQDADYAERYRRVIASVRQAEGRRPGAGGFPFTRVVARNLFKLMAYKDEYEVARLLTDDSFLHDLRARFGDGSRLTFHLAPPLLARMNPETGEPRKMTFGPWILTAMRGLSRLKGLRGTPFDPFGRTAERKAERLLVEDYRALVESLAPSLAPETLAAAIELAALPDQVRGYGHVKSKAIADYHARKAQLLARMKESKVLHRTAA